ncbi:MAG TPA: hypothetical protein VIW24_04120 [Aldersonia sp.]
MAPPPRCWWWSWGVARAASRLVEFSVTGRGLLRRFRARAAAARYVSTLGILRRDLTLQVVNAGTSEDIAGDAGTDDQRDTAAAIA